MHGLLNKNGAATLDAYAYSSAKTNTIRKRLLMKYVKSGSSTKLLGVSGDEVIAELAHVLLELTDSSHYVPKQQIGYSFFYVH